MKAAAPVVPFPDPPADIARRILETAARSSVEDTLRLVLLSKVVRTWIDPILYHTMCLNTTRVKKLAYSIQARDDAHFFQTHVKRVFFYHVDTSDRDCMIRILDTCTGIVRLGWWQDRVNISPWEVDYGLAERCPTHLSVHTELLHHITDILAPSITHLQLFFPYSQMIPQGGVISYKKVLAVTCPWKEVFASCPNISHLAFEYVDFDFIVPAWSGYAAQFVSDLLLMAPMTLHALIIEIGDDMAGLLADDRHLANRYHYDVIKGLLDSIKDPRFVIVAATKTIFPQVAFYSSRIEKDEEFMMDWSYNHFDSGPLVDLWELAEMGIRDRESKKT